MLDGFGLAPVCIELDLDSYDGPWTHVERFRGRSGWLVVAEAEVVSAGAGWETSIIAACDDCFEPVPPFMVPNLLACACSLPAGCDEYPPEDLQELLVEAAQELKLHWLRESNAALAALTEAAAAQINELEGRARREIDGLDFRIADLRRRRRMLGLSDSAREIMRESILAFEEERDAVTEQLAQQRAQLRASVAEEEQRVIRRTRVHVEVEPHYYVKWSASARWHEDWGVALEQASRFTGCIPGSYFDPNRGPRLFKAEVPPDEEIQAKSSASSTAVANREVSKANDEERRRLDELDDLKKSLARVEADAIKFCAGSRKFVRNQQQQAFLRERIGKLEASAGRSTVSWATSSPTDERLNTANLHVQREQLAAELASHQRSGARREDGSNRFIRYGERRRALIAEIEQLDRRIAATQPLAEVDP